MTKPAARRLSSRALPVKREPAGARWSVDRVRRLRLQAHAMGVPWYSPELCSAELEERPAVMREMLRLAVEDAHRSPTIDELIAVAGVDHVQLAEEMEPVAGDPEARARDGWLLFKSAHVPEALLKALRVASAWRLAAAIRALDPIGDTIETKAWQSERREEVRQLRASLQAAKNALAAFEAAFRTDTVYRDDRAGGMWRLDERLAELEQLLVEPIRERLHAAESHLAFARGRGDVSLPWSRLPQQRLAEDRALWWVPVEDALRNAGWEWEQIVELIRGEGWFAALAPGHAAVDQRDLIDRASRRRRAAK